MTSKHRPIVHAVALALASAVAFAQNPTAENQPETAMVKIDSLLSDAKVFLEAMPGLRRIYDKTPGKRMMCFTLADSRAELIQLMPPGGVLLDETPRADGP